MFFELLHPKLCITCLVGAERAGGARCSTVESLAIMFVMIVLAGLEL